MADFPRSLVEFQRRFPDERACAVDKVDQRPWCSVIAILVSSISDPNSRCRSILLGGYETASGDNFT